MTTTFELDAQTEEIVAPLLALPAAQRHALIGKLWDSLEAGDVPTPPGLLDELERRRAHFEKHPESAVSWESLQGGIRLRHGL